MVYSRRVQRIHSTRFHQLDRSQRTLCSTFSLQALEQRVSSKSQLRSHAQVCTPQSWSICARAHSLVTRRDKGRLQLPGTANHHIFAEGLSLLGPGWHLTMYPLEDLVLPFRSTGGWRNNCPNGCIAPPRTMMFLGQEGPHHHYSTLSASNRTHREQTYIWNHHSRSFTGRKRHLNMASLCHRQLELGAVSLISPRNMLRQFEAHSRDRRAART
jgi:hypothetical protein